jgi:uncharacterized metal-binding protein YceD (DUF177 family)
MKIEFKKIPSVVKNFEDSFASVKIEGNFCKISQKVVKVEALLKGDVEVQCCKCGEDFTKNIDESISFLVSDGIYSTKTNTDDIVIESFDGNVDFHKIIQGEIESFKSDYHICDKCKKL